MKRILLVFTALLLCLSLTACAGGEAPAEPFDPAADGEALLGLEGAFTSSLTAIDVDVACALYGIDRDTVTSAAVYGATDSAEELAVFAFTDESAAEDGAAALRGRVEDRREELADYLPGEIPKLDKAVVETRGSSALLVIAADYGPVDTFLGG